MSTSSVNAMSHHCDISTGDGDVWTFCNNLQDHKYALSIAFYENMFVTFLLVNGILYQSLLLYWRHSFEENTTAIFSLSGVHGVNMGPTWVLSAPDGPHVCPTNLAIRVAIICRLIAVMTQTYINQTWSITVPLWWGFKSVIPLYFVTVTLE